ncbi:MAG: type II secretion system F family protein [Candidatus Thermoplasmatota archaeon]|nr:type II secretion system F family protein [Candidatus Thermoplasmatota archaeon]
MAGDAKSLMDSLQARRRAEVQAAEHPGLDPNEPHMIKLPAGSQPGHIGLTSFQRFAWRLMGSAVQDKEIDEDLEENLLKAHMRLRPEEYLAVSYTATFLTALTTIIAALGLGFLLLVIMGGALFPWIIIPVLLAVVPTVMVRGVFLGMGFTKGIPAGRAKRRARKIDRKLTGVMSFISAMASANVPVDVIFRELARQQIYGEIREEAEWITRDTELLGTDILTALRRGARRTPSAKFQEFLQGVVTTATSGGQMKPYFLMKAEQFEKEDKLEMKKRMESLGLLAESFVTVVVAFPLFLVVIMAIMALISKGSSGFVVTLLYVIVGLMIPISQFGFIFVIWNQEQEAK